MYEELINTEEVRRTLESDDFFIIRPALEGDIMRYQYTGMPVQPAKMPYTSDASPAMTCAALEEYLYAGALLEKTEPAKTTLKVVTA